MTRKPLLFDGSIARKDLLRGCRMAAGLDLAIFGKRAARFSLEGDAGSGTEIFRYDDASDHLHVGFFSSGTVIKGYAQQSPLNPFAHALIQPRFGIYSAMPEDLLRQLRSTSSFDWEAVTFCFWRGKRDTHWWEGDVDKRRGDDDGSGSLLLRLPTDAPAFGRYAEEVHGVELDAQLLVKLFRRGRFTERDVAALAPSRKAKSPQAGLAAISGTR